MTGELVFAGEATLDDFARLEREEISVQVKIVLAQCGGNYPGMKVRSSHSHPHLSPPSSYTAHNNSHPQVKAASDANKIHHHPHLLLPEDGFVTVAADYAPYPLGPARNIASAQRSRVQSLNAYSGDPGLPERPAYERVTHDLEMEEDSEIPWGEDNLPGIVIRECAHQLGRWGAAENLAIACSPFISNASKHSAEFEV